MTAEWKSNQIIREKRKTLKEFNSKEQNSYQKTVRELKKAS